MQKSKEELVSQIEKARKELNESIDTKQKYEKVYQNSVALDHLIEQYIVAGF